MDYRITKLIFLFILLTFTPIATAKNGKIKKLTPAEITDVNDFVSTLSDPNFIRGIEDSKDFKHTNVRCEPQMRALRGWHKRVINGEITRKNRGGEIVVATEEDLRKITRLDRWYNSDLIILQGIFDGTHCVLDGHDKRLDRSN